MAKKAFIVGIKTFKLKFSERDADLMSECLKRYGYEVITPEATKSDINVQFEKLLYSCGKTDTLLVYFSGHGWVNNRNLFFVIKKDMDNISNIINIKNDIVYKLSNHCYASNKLLILDCCNAARAYDDWHLDPLDSCFILTASNRLVPRAKEIEKLKASFLTHRFQQALNEPQPGILDLKNKTIRVSELYKWIVKEAQNYNLLEKTTKTTRVPEPSLLGDLNSDFALVTLTDSMINDLPQPLSDEERRKQEAEERYRALALESCDIIDLANLPENRRVAARELELRRLYVPLRMRVEAKAGDYTDEATPEGLEKRRQGLLSEREPDEEASKRVSIGERLREARRLVVLGDQGAGKSTLLRWLTTAYLLREGEEPAWQGVPDVESLPDEAWLPVLIRCRDLDPDCLSLHDMLERTFRKNQLVTSSEILQTVIEEKSRNGEVLLLIDGLDEISKASDRISLCETINNIAIAYPKAPIIVTSRIVGYHDMGGSYLKKRFEHLTITDFSPEDKDDFARRWCAITVPAERQKKVTDELIQAIHSNERIEGLTGNPMLLTTLGLVKGEVGQLSTDQANLYFKVDKLPTNRANLYFNAVRVLLNWRKEVDEWLDYDEAEPQLHYLAYAMCDQGVQQLRKDQIIELLTTMRKEYPDLEPIKNRSPHQFLSLLERRTGILVKVGHVRHNGEPKPVYEFRHLTYQEYLAGLALVKGYFPNRDKSLTLPDYVAPLAGCTSKRTNELYEDEVVVTEEWREPLRLCVAACNDNDVDNVLNAILTPLPNENAAITTRPRAVLAALCLADEPNVSETMADRIMKNIVKLVSNRDTRWYGSLELKRAAMELAASRWGQTLRLCLVEEFCRRDASNREPVGTVCGAVINATIPDNQEALLAWLAEQITYLASDIEAKAIEVALGIVGAQRRAHIWRYNATEAAKWLIAMLHANGPTAHAAAWALATLHNKRSKAWQPLRAQRERMIAIVNDPDTDAGVLSWLASILGQARDSQAVKPLSARLDNPHVSVRRAVAEALGEIGDAQAVQPLIARLDDPDRKVREVVAEALGKIGDAQAVQPLIAHLDHPEASVRQAVAKILGKIGDAQAIEPLIARFDDPESEVRIAIAEALAKIGDARAIEPLIARFDDPEHKVRTNVAEAVLVLIGIGIGNAQVVQPLIARLDDPSEWVRGGVAAILGEIGDAQAVQPLISRLNDLSEVVGIHVAEALGKIGDIQAVEPLIARLDDPYESVRQVVAKALREIGDARAVEPLIARLDDPSESVRRFAADALGTIGDARGISILRERLSDHDSQIRHEALFGLAQTCDEIDRKLIFDKKSYLYRFHPLNIFKNGFLDPDPFFNRQEEIGESQVRRAVRALNLSMEEVKQRYEALAVRFGLKLAWQAEVVSGASP